MDNWKKFIEVVNVGIALIFLALIRLYVYYDFFKIDIVSFISVGESFGAVITSSLDVAIYIVPILILSLFLVNLVQNNFPSIQKKDSDSKQPDTKKIPAVRITLLHAKFRRLICTLLRYIKRLWSTIKEPAKRLWSTIKEPTLWIFLILAIIFNFFATIYLGLTLGKESVTSQDHHSLEGWVGIIFGLSGIIFFLTALFILSRMWNVISFNLEDNPLLKELIIANMLLSFLTFVMLKGYMSARNFRENKTAVSFRINGENIVTADAGSLYYIGQTEKYLFLYDDKNKRTSVYTMDKMDDLSFGVKSDSTFSKSLSPSVTDSSAHTTIDQSIKIIIGR